MIDNTEKQIVALALFGYVMRAGPGQFQQVIAIADKIGVTEQLNAYASDWVLEAKTTAIEPANLNNEPRATVQFAIFHGITTQWHQKDHPNFAKTLRDSIYKELFEGNYYKSAIKELLT